MKKFMVLYMASGPEFEKMKQSSTPDRQKEGMEAWRHGGMEEVDER